MKRRYVTIAGRRWSLIFATTKEDSRLRELDGFTTDPSAGKRCMVIRSSLSAKGLAEIVIHEALHASAWPIDDGAVTQYAEDVTRILWRLGFRQTEDDNGQR